MFTQCPECGTVFRVTADALRVAQGTVRCGICSNSFDAIEFLSEQPAPRRGEDAPQDDTITVEELPGNEVIELSAPGESTAEPPRSEPLAGTEDDDDSSAAALDAAGDTELEFHGTAGELERLFVSADMGSSRLSAGNDADAYFDSAIGAMADGEFSGIEVVEERLPGARNRAGGESADPGRVASVLSFPGASAQGDDESGRDDLAARAWDDDTDNLDSTGEFPVLEPDQADDEADAPLQLLIPEELRRGAASSSVAGDFESEPESHRRRWPLVLTAAVLLLVLAAQAVHFWRDDLARNPVAGPWLIRAYSLLGINLALPQDLASFEVRQLGAASDGAQAGRIKLRASIVNRAPFAQPLPLLRLSLQDRFGSTIGVRDLQPGEYLPGGTAPASGLLGPSQRVDAEVVFVDPGRDAVGFELDVCLRDAAGIRCSATNNSQS